MVPSAATASVPQLLHFPLNVDIWREGAGFNKRVWFGRGSVLGVIFKTLKPKTDKNGYTNCYFCIKKHQTRCTCKIK